MTDSARRQHCKTDVLIVGGGIAGLWLLARLRTAGFGALLLESDRLGQGQTRFAQGIIHGGTKYSLQGALSDSAKAVAAMPARWRSCLQDGGELDLGAVQVLSQRHYLWANDSLTERMTGFLASRAMRARTESLRGEQRPAVFQHPDFHGQVYGLDEPVIDTVSLVRALAAPRQERTLRVRWPAHMHVSLEDGVQVRLEDEHAGQLELRANWLVNCAGAGNHAMLESLGRHQPVMQRRPLHMVLARGALPPVYAHCLGRSANPRITITTHPHSSGDAIWYLGGQLAEDGVARSTPEQIEAAQTELAALLPWVEQQALRWQAFTVDRAEPRQTDGSRPASAFVAQDGPLITAWPVKLALTPLLADRVLALVRGRGARTDLDALPEWPRPEVAPAPWEEMQWN